VTETADCPVAVWEKLAEKDLLSEKRRNTISNQILSAAKRVARAVSKSFTCLSATCCSCTKSDKQKEQKET
jgi:hypothetical protein